MKQNEFELLLNKSITDSSAFDLWKLPKVKDYINIQGENINQRTLERKITNIQWLECGSLASDQVDEFALPSKQIIFENLVQQSRKKRKRTFFVRLNTIPKPKNSKLKNVKKLYILVAQDGKGSKRWCLLDRNNEKSILKGLEIISEHKAVHFFPSGELVGFCKNFNNTCNSKSNSICIKLGHFQELSKQKSHTKIVKNIPSPISAKLSHLEMLEAESIFIMREVMANANNPVMLYSVGKDSAVMLHLAKKAFYPSPPPFPLLHVDTTWKFQAMYKFRDEMAKEAKMELIVHTNPDGIKKNINPFDHGSSLHTDIMKTQGLKQALDKYNFDVAFGGARRDEEKSRAKERIFSFRNKNHRWDPKNQRPELWNLFNCKKAPGESVRVFPISNWTELDIWEYIYRENISIVPLYFSKTRPIVYRDGMMIMVDDDRMRLKKGESIEMKKVRFRTLGCYPLTGAIESSAEDISDILIELLQSRTSEREGRTIDSDETASMEKKKQEGYF